MSRMTEISFSRFMTNMLMPTRYSSGAAKPAAISTSLPLSSSFIES